MTTTQTTRTTVTQPRYTCRGSVRGSCGIRHLSYAAAERCCERDQRACRSQGATAYSDRAPVEVRS